VAPAIQSSTARISEQRESGRNPLRCFAAEIWYSHQVDHPSKAFKKKDDKKVDGKNDQKKDDEKEAARMALPFAGRTARVVTGLSPFCSLRGSL